MDLHWFGFRKLRPARAEDMSARVVAILCLVYCPLSALIAFLISYFTLQAAAARRPPAAVSWFIAGAAALLYLLMQGLLARAWNQRAARIRAEQSSTTS
jgi:hypothetical protein